MEYINSISSTDDRKIVEFYNLNLTSLNSKLLCTTSKCLKAEKIYSFSTSGNILSTLDNNFLHLLTNLNILNLMSNSIREINIGSLSGLSKLIQLNMSSNLISDIRREMFTDLTELYILDLSHNVLTSFRFDDVLSCIQLRKLYLHHNVLDVMIGDMSLIRRLELLDLGYNDLSNIEYTGMEGYLKSGKKLIITDNLKLAFSCRSHWILNKRSSLLIEFDPGMTKWRLAKGVDSEDSSSDLNGDNLNGEILSNNTGRGIADNGVKVQSNVSDSTHDIGVGQKNNETKQFIKVDKECVFYYNDKLDRCETQSKLFYNIKNVCESIGVYIIYLHNIE